MSLAATFRGQASAPLSGTVHSDRRGSRVAGDIYAPNLGPHWRHNAIDGWLFGRIAGWAAGDSGEILVVAARGLKLLGLAALVAFASGAAQAENLDAGKSPSALFAASCAACHSSPRGLAKGRGSGTLASFLQEHYTSGPQTAASLAAYLVANPGSPPRGKQEPAGRAAATPPEGAGKQTHPPYTATMRPDSMIEPATPGRPGPEASKGKGKRQQTKQEAPAPAASVPEPPAAVPAAPSAPTPPPAAPVAAAPPPPDQPAFSAPSP